MIEAIWRLIGKLSGFIKYGLVGSVGFAVHLLVLWLLTDYLHLWYMVSAAIAIVVAALNNYILNYHWTFKDKKANINNQFVGYFKYLLSRGFTEGLYLALLYLMTDIVGFHYMASAVLVQVVTAVVGYYIALKWIWRRRKKNNNVREVIVEKVLD
jgi:putative flippase GtrA